MANNRESPDGKAAGMRFSFRNSLFLPLCGLLLLTVLLVPPRGDFPLNDDWIFATTVEGILETGSYTPNPYGDPTLIAQAYWGALFCKAFGYSYPMLRVSTLVLCLLGAWAAAHCARACGLPYGAALVSGGIFIANPFVLNLSYTFMTDVPFVALSTLSGLFFLRSIRNPGPTKVWLGSSAAVIAFFIRQFGLIMPIAYAATIMVLVVRKRTSVTWQTALALLAPWAVAGVLFFMLPDIRGGGGLTWDWSELGRTTFQRAHTVFGHLLIGAVYLSFLSLPLLAGRLVSLGSKGASLKWIAVGVGAAVLLCYEYVAFIPEWHRIPRLGNLLYDLGVGPLLLRGSVADGEILAPLRIGWFWSVITAACLLSTTLFVLDNMPSLFQAFRRKSAEEESETDAGPGQDVFLFVWGLGMLLVLIVPAIAIRFDRYFIIALVPWVLLGLRHARIGTQRRPTVAAAMTLALMYVLSVVCLQDYLAWNDARWKALDRLQSEYNAPPEEIDGGYEFNGLHTSGQFATDPGEERDFGPQGWWLVGDTYAVSLHPRDNFEEIGTERYFSWLGMQTREILLLQRTGEAESP